MTKSWVIALIGVGVVTAGGLALKAQSLLSSHQPAQLSVWAPWSPYDTDPLKFDSFIHHVAFRSVTGSLVTQYRVGSFTGLISDQWVVSKDQKTWTFHIRSGSHFENGDEIKPLHVIRSWRRLAYLLKKSGSRSEFFDSVLGAQKIESPNAEIEGLKSNGDDLIITLARPFSKPLETISFGIYAIVHPNDFDALSGAWKDPHHVTSASAYRISSWTDHELELSLRTDLNWNFIHPNPFKKIKIKWRPEDHKEADILLGDSNDKSMPGLYKFYGGTPSGIAFARCFSAKFKGTVCDSNEKRLAIRELVYEAMSQSGIQAIRSFFPLPMKGISEISNEIPLNPAAIRESLGGKKIRFYLRKKQGNEIYDAIKKNLAEIGSKYGVQFTEVELTTPELIEAMNETHHDPNVDLGILVTGILIEDPYSDIRFMTLSKEGIRLPDLTGEIQLEASKADLDPQKINELLWKQGAIIPLGHFSAGVWAKEHVDLSMLNAILPPIEFLWVGSTQ